MCGSQVRGERKQKDDESCRTKGPKGGLGGDIANPLRHSLMPKSEGGMGALLVPVRQFIGCKARNPCTYLHDTERADMNE